MSTGTSEHLPVWDFDGMEGNFSNPSWQARLKKLKNSVAVAHRLALKSPGQNEAAEINSFSEWLEQTIKSVNAAHDLSEELGSIAHAAYTVNTKNTEAILQVNSIEEAVLPLSDASVRIMRSLRQQKTLVGKVLSEKPALADYRFALKELMEQAEHLMSPEEEALAEDLGRSGGEAWGRLQQSISSALTSTLDGEQKTVTQLRMLAHSPDRGVRSRAFAAECDAWKRVAIPMAASINGVKGTSIVLNKRRGYKNPLDKAAFQARMSRNALDSMIIAMQNQLPLYRRYFAAKARLLGLPRLAFFDLFAPIGNARTWSWDEARTFITETLHSFSTDLGDFVDRAFENNWIDALSREGKIGGAYCTSLPLTKESRILANFDGTFNAVLTLAHELGHAYHHEILKDRPALLRQYPMTLAETASIFTETLVLNRAKTDPAMRLHAVEQFLQDSAQVVVDILSRFLFEKDVFARRNQGELSSDELCSLMVEAQKATYGDALDENHLHPWMWAVKIHYYSPGLAFYNFPYAFGHLFSLHLAARAQAEGPSFAGTYKKVLAMTGSASAREVAKKAGFDIENPSSWRDSFALIAQSVDELERLLPK